jgi:hypothetical protein
MVGIASLVVKVKTGPAVIDIDIFVNCSWVDTRWQYTFTRNT